MSKMARYVHRMRMTCDRCGEKKFLNVATFRRARTEMNGFEKKHKGCRDEK